MNKDKALKMAVVALEKAQHAMQTDMGVDVIEEAMNACKEALAQPAWQGLTAYELEDIKDNSKEGWYQLVRNVEQALRERNT
jgi:hypothetical protein